MQLARLDGIVHDLEGDEADDVGVARFSGEEGEADVAGRGIGAELTQKFQSLRFESLVGGGVPCEFNSILNLQAMVSRGVGFGKRWRAHLDLEIHGRRIRG